MEAERSPNLKFENDPSRIAEVAAGAVALSRMQRPHHRVQEQFDTDFPAYAKIFHAVFRDRSVDERSVWDDERDDEVDAWLRDSRGDRVSALVTSRSGTSGQDLSSLERVLWAELLDEPLSAETDWRELATVFEGPSWPRWVVGPDEGTLDRLTLAGLISVLEDACGSDAMTWMFLETWEARARHVPEEAELGHGPIRSIIAFVNETGTTPRSWWDDGGHWGFANDRDSCTSVVAGSDALIEGLLANPLVEAIVVEPGDVLFPYCNCGH